MSFRVVAVVGAIVASALVTAACTGPSPEPSGPASSTPGPSVTASASPTPTPSATPSATAVPAAEPPTDEAPFVADRSPDTEDASADARLSPVNIRFGVQDGYDRIVLDLEGAGAPGWLTEYDPAPTSTGSGEPVELEGNAYLVAHVTGVIYPTEDGAAEYVGPATFRPSGGIVEEVVYGPVFEGQLEIYIGLSSDQPFRVFRLADPARVIIDVMHP